LEWWQPDRSPKVLLTFFAFLKTKITNCDLL